jgi:uncharacterized protein
MRVFTGKARPGRPGSPLGRPGGGGSPAYLRMRAMGSPERSLSLMDGLFAVCRLDKNATLPGWATGGEFFSVSRTPDELSIVCPRERVPGGVDHDADWRCLKVESPFEFDLAGVISSVAHRLAEAPMDVFVVATQDSDYLLVRERDFEKAVEVAADAGYSVEI